MKTEQQVVTKIVEISQNIQYCRDKIDYSQLDEDTSSTQQLLEKRKIELDTLTWLFS